MPEGADSPPVACAWCGAAAPPGGVPMTWMASVERSGGSASTRYYCERCARENVRAVEGKLDTAWW